MTAQVFTNSNSALASGDWAKRVMPVMEAQARQLERDGRAALDNHPFRPTRSRRLPAEAKEALIADYELHNPLGIARTARHTIPYSSVRDRIDGTRVPTLLVAGDREEGFRDQGEFAEQAIAGISVVHLNTGHAVNIEDAAGFNAAVGTSSRPTSSTIRRGATDCFKRGVRGASHWPIRLSARRIRCEIRPVS